jgi:hypothetical protein
MSKISMSKEIGFTANEQLRASGLEMKKIFKENLKEKHIEKFDIFTLKTQNIEKIKAVKEKEKKVKP